MLPEPCPHEAFRFSSELNAKLLIVRNPLHEIKQNGHGRCILAGISEKSKHCFRSDFNTLKCTKVILLTENRFRNKNSVDMMKLYMMEHTQESFSPLILLQNFSAGKVFTF